MEPFTLGSMILQGGNMLGGMLGRDGGTRGANRGGDLYWKELRPELKDLSQQMADWAKGAANPNGLMQAGYDSAMGLGQSLSPAMGYAQMLLNAGLPALGGAMGVGSALANFNPFQASAPFMQAGAANAQYGQQLADQIMRSAPVEQAITAANRDMWRNLNWNQLPGLASQASQSGNVGSSKWKQQNTLATQMTADRAADTTANIMNNAWNTATGLGGQYGLANAGFQQQAGLQNASQFNEFGSKMALGNAQMANQYGLGSLGAAGNLFGNVLNQSAGMFSPYAQMMMNLPQIQFGLGQSFQQSPLDIYTKTLNSLQSVATGAGGSLAQSRPNTLGGALGQLTSAGIEGGWADKIGNWILNGFGGGGSTGGGAQMPPSGPMDWTSWAFGK